MYHARLWSSRHSRGLEIVYNAVNPSLLSVLRGVSKLFGRRFDKPITALESMAKGFLFDCQMCGDCILSKTGMSCPMNCPKTIRNGPCGGVRANGMCEVNPNMRCVWVDAWNGAAQMKNGGAIKDIQFAVNNQNQGTSSWLRMVRDE